MIMFVAAFIFAFIASLLALKATKKKHIIRFVMRQRYYGLCGAERVAQRKTVSGFGKVIKDWEDI